MDKKTEFGTIVKKQNWAYFISQLENNTNLKWSFISKLTNYNPFNKYNLYVGVEVSSDGCIWIFDNIDKPIDIWSNEDFVNYQLP